jgi:hypothetical protein
VPQEHRLENMSGPDGRSIRNVADQNMIEETARDMAKKTADDDRLTVELSSDPSALTPGAARAVLRMLLEARDKQTGKELDADAEQRPNDSASSRPRRKRASGCASRNPSVI